MVKLTPTKMGRVAEMSHRGMSTRDIAADLKKRWNMTITHQAIQKRLRAAEQRSGSLYPSHSPGRPLKLSEHQQRLILRDLNQNPFASFRSIAGEHTTSEQSIARLANRHLLYRFTAAEKPFLQPEHLQARLKWARENVEQDWRRVIYTDEAAVVSGDRKGKA